MKTQKLLAVLLAFLLAFSLSACEFLPEISELTETAVTKTAEIKTAETKPSETEPAETEQAETTPAETEPAETEPAETEPAEILPDPEGSYTSKEDVALYIHVYGCLPSNFITKKEAEALGWKGGGLEKIAPGKCIGGTRFGNNEGLLPDAKGRKYTECDIDTLGAKSRGAKRIVFSNDGLIYYTEDHYESFILLYTAEGAVP